MTDWVPTLVSIEGPRYLAFVLALEADIASGRVKPGMRLLPQRDMAQRLDLSVGTISKAYAEAEQRGLISGEYTVLAWEDPDNNVRDPEFLNTWQDRGEKVQLDDAARKSVSVKVIAATDEPSQ